MTRRRAYCDLSPHKQLRTPNRSMFCWHVRSTAARKIKKSGRKIPFDLVLVNNWPRDGRLVQLLELSIERRRRIKRIRNRIGSRPPRILWNVLILHCCPSIDIFRSDLIPFSIQMLQSGHDNPYPAAAVGDDQGTGVPTRS